MNTTAWRISACVIFPIFIMYFLYTTAPIPNSEANGFTRNFISILPQFIASTKSPLNTKAIIGYYDNKLYLETDTSGIIIETDVYGNKHKIENYNIAYDKRNIIGDYFKSNITKDRIALFAVNIPAFMQMEKSKNGSLDWKITKLPSFIYGIEYTRNQAILRMRSKTDQSNFFGKVYLNIDSAPIIAKLSEKLETKGIQGDGKIGYDSLTKLVTYMYYYNNTIMLFDTGFLKIKYIHTIANNIKTKELGILNSGNSEGSLGKKRPPLVINQTNCINKGILLLASNLKADNESKNDYDKNIPIDAYNLLSGIYLGSFYLPLKNNSLFKTMFWTENHLFTLSHDNIISTYDFNVEKLIN